MQIKPPLLHIIFLIAMTFLLVHCSDNESGSISDSRTPEMPVQIERALHQKSNELAEDKHFVNDSLYVWDDQLVNWVSVGLYVPPNPDSIDISTFSLPQSEDPIKVKWELLMNIGYRLRYFDQIQMDMFAPVFTRELQKLHGQEVIVKGYVIPFDEEGELIALSHNPYSACFFCGNASPASVISMYLEDPNTSCELDDYKTFKGTLYLNHDDPEQFYYILKNAVIV